MIKNLLPGPRTGCLVVPSSKSAAHRVLICAALGETLVTVALKGLSRDVQATAECLRVLGAGIEIGEDNIRVSPIRRKGFVTGPVVLPVGESGSTLRFLLPLAGALGVDAVFQTEGRLAQRPLSPLDDELRAHGMVIWQQGSKLYCSGKLHSGEYTLPGNISSQFFSGLLMALPLLDGESNLTAIGTLESSAYLRITEQVLALAGMMPEKGGSDGQNAHLWRICGGGRPQLPSFIQIEGDWSNAAFFLCMGALSDAGVTVESLRSDSAQGDKKILQLLQDFGAVVTEDTGDSGCITVSRGNTFPLRVDASEIPDLVPVLAVLCCAAKGESEITRASRLRLKESDRLKTTSELIRSLGGTVQELPDGLIIRGSGSLRGGETDSFNDHRIAMSAAVAASLCREPVLLHNPDCVRKSYPDFWTDFEMLARCGNNQPACIDQTPAETEEKP